jgi:3-deoxy-7-phosphoheptulonate synthase
MIIVMRSTATAEQFEHAQQRVRELGLTPHPIQGTELRVIAVVGDERAITPDVFEVLPGVDKVMPVLAPYKLASAEGHPAPSVISVGAAKFGGKKIGVIAGPCAVESEKQILATARAVKAAGACMLRGGAFKPRTSPYQFQGMGEEGLRLLAAAREATGLPVVTEVVTPAHVELVYRYTDCLQIGARNMQNFLLLAEVGRADKPVLLKRGMSATIDEFLHAAEYVMSQGNGNVILCERGIRTFETHTRNTLSLTAVPALKERTHLPVIVDPSHGTGHARYVAPMARAAVACGADGVMVEVHPDPESAVSDREQALSFTAFESMMTQLRPVAEAVGRSI